MATPFDRVGIASEPELLTVKQVAYQLKVSESWVRHHKTELPLVPLGRAVRFDASHLPRYAGNGKPLDRNRIMRISAKRKQQGSVQEVKGKKESVWYGIFRQAGKQVKVRLGTEQELAEEKPMLTAKLAAQVKLAEMLANPSQNTLVKQSFTFAEIVERWKASKGPTMRETTFRHYRKALSTGVIPMLGNLKVEDVTLEHTQAFLNTQAKRYSESSLKSMLLASRIVFNWAIDAKLAKDNPFAKAEIPEETGGKRIVRTYLTRTQIQQIADSLDEPYASLFLLLADTGLRISEALALKLSDLKVSDSKPVVDITHRLDLGANKDGKLKSKRARRILPISQELADRLLALPRINDLVFCSKNATPLHSNILKRIIHPACRRVGIQIGGFHDLRHSLSREMRRAGVHPVVLARQLGHGEVTMAAEHYDMATLEDLREAQSKLPKLQKVTFGNDKILIPSHLEA